MCEMVLIENFCEKTVFIFLGKKLMIHVVPQKSFIVTELGEYYIPVEKLDTLRFSYKPKPSYPQRLDYNDKIKISIIGL